MPVGFLSAWVALSRLEGRPRPPNPLANSAEIITDWLFGAAILVVPVLIVAIWMRGARLADPGFVGASVGDASLFIPAALLADEGAASVWHRVAQHFGISLQPDMLKAFGTGWRGFALALLLAAVIGPISEEIFFRGFLFAGLRKAYPFWVAAWISALIFAAMHLVPGAIVSLSFMGFLLAWLRERTGSLWPSIVLHMINNAIYFSESFAEQHFHS
jgi:membrane protease YdiL (CAAX protease family)